MAEAEAEAEAALEAEAEAEAETLKTLRWWRSIGHSDESSCSSDSEADASDDEGQVEAEVDAKANAESKGGEEADAVPEAEADTGAEGVTMRWRSRQASQSSTGDALSDEEEYHSADEIMLPPPVASAHSPSAPPPASPWIAVHRRFTRHISPDAILARRLFDVVAPSSQPLLPPPPATVPIYSLCKPSDAWPLSPSLVTDVATPTTASTKETTSGGAQLTPPPQWTSTNSHSSYSPNSIIASI